MSFWIITGVLAITVAAVLAVVLIGPRRSLSDPAQFDLKVYRDQLKEVERDVERGVIQPDDAERARTEISRRILALDAENRQTAETSGPNPIAQSSVAIGLSIALIAGAFAIYQSLGAPGYGDLGLQTRIDAAEQARQNRPVQADAEAGVPQTPNVEVSPDYIALVEQLRTTVAERPDDLQGHILLVNSEGRLGNYIAAYTAQETILRLKGDEATGEDFANYADMLVLAAGGYVSPKAEAALNQALQLDPQNGPARYYFGLMMSQTGRPDVAFRMWEGLLATSQPDAGWVPAIRAQIEEMAFRAGVTYTLPPEGAAPTRGPSAADIDAAQGMTPAERLEMIEGMVGGLAERLASEGGPPQEWARLISALVVLARVDDAIAVHTNAVEVFADNKPALDIVNRAASDAGFLE